MANKTKYVILHLPTAEHVYTDKDDKINENMRFWTQWEIDGYGTGHKNDNSNKTKIFTSKKTLKLLLKLLEVDSTYLEFHEDDQGEFSKPLYFEIVRVHD